MGNLTPGMLAVLSLTTAGRLDLDTNPEIGFEDDFAGDLDFGGDFDDLDDDDGFDGDLDDVDDDDDDLDDSDDPEELRERAEELIEQAEEIEDAGFEGDFGFSGSRKRRAKRKRRRAKRLMKRARQLDGKKRRRRRGARGRKNPSGGGARMVKQTVRRWGKAVLSESKTVATAGSDSIVIRPQHDFKAHDITFAGSASDAKVTSVHFGDKQVWNNLNGIPVAVFATASFLRGVLKGHVIRAGLDITIGVITQTDADVVVATIIGQKPAGTYTKIVRR